MRGDVAAVAASLLAGGAIWGWVALAGGRAEPWDAPQFWSAGYPAALAACAILGWIWPRGAWRWAALVFAMLLVVMLAGTVGTGSSFSMLPPGLVLLAVLALPGVALAALAGWARRR
jgi:hypothetical protein